MADAAENSITAYNEAHSTEVKNELLQRLVNLASLRTSESSDVIIICGKKEFYAHRLVLEASSPYFVAMFRSGMDEAITKKVKLEEVQPEVLDAILDYIYLGEVKKMQSISMIKEVLATSHLMGLKELFNYCIGFLVRSVSVESFSELWEIGRKYEEEKLTDKILLFILSKLTDVLDSKESELISFDLLLHLIKFHKDKGGNSDKILQLMVKWLMYDPAERDKSARELFALVNVSLVSKECIISLLEDKKIIEASEEIGNRMNELGVAAFLHFNSLAAESAPSPPSHSPARHPQPANQYYNPAIGRFMAYEYGCNYDKAIFQYGEN